MVLIHAFRTGGMDESESVLLTEQQFSKVEPHLPSDTRGKARVYDRRIIGGIVHVLKSGGRWIDAPPQYGPMKTLCNRYVRWAARLHADWPPSRRLHSRGSAA